LKKIGPKTLMAYRGRMINIHPSLLPRHGGQGMYGLRVHEAVLAAGEPATGVTIHRVEAEYDKGMVLAQRTVPVKPDDTAESLAGRVLVSEHALLVETVDLIHTFGVHNVRGIPTTGSIQHNVVRSFVGG